MKRSSSHGFTLIEMLTVMAIIAILASMVIGINGFVQRKAAMARAEGEIAALSVACEQFKGDNGFYPRDFDEKTTDELDPRSIGNPNDTKFLKANIFFYKMISGDAGPGGAGKETTSDTKGDPDGKPESKAYFEFASRKDMIRMSSDKTKVIAMVDPFGNPYGYSTAGAAEEEDYQKDLNKKKDGDSAKRGTKGYNVTFDLWSTGGSTGKDQAKWIKNW